MSLGMTMDCFLPANTCHNCEKKLSNRFKKNPGAVKDYKRCGNCHLLSYCDKVCQKQHWEKVHKNHCKFLSGKVREKNCDHNAVTCARCIEERQSSATELKSGNSPKTFCRIEEDANAMKEMLNYTFGFHEGGKKGHCSLQFPWELLFPLGEVSGEYMEEGNTGLDAMLAYTLKILGAMFDKAQEEEHKNALVQMWNDIIHERTVLWYGILVFGMCGMLDNLHLSEKVYNLGSMYGPSNPWWKSLKFAVDFVIKTKNNLLSNFEDSRSLEDKRFLKLKPLYDYRQSQLQNQEMVCKNQTWPNFMVWPRFVNGSLTILLPPSTRCHSCHAELRGEVAVSPHELDFESLPTLFPFVGDKGALVACCPTITNPNCRKDYVSKNEEIQMLDESKWKEMSKVNELFAIEGRECDFCLKLSLFSHRCSSCLATQYCSTFCQKEDLEFHNSVCATWAKDESRRIGGKGKQKDYMKNLFEEKADQEGKKSDRKPEANRDKNNVRKKVDDLALLENKLKEKGIFFKIENLQKKFKFCACHFNDEEVSSLEDVDSFSELNKLFNALCNKYGKVVSVAEGLGDRIPNDWEEVRKLAETKVSESSKKEWKNKKDANKRKLRRKML